MTAQGKSIGEDNAMFTVTSLGGVPEVKLRVVKGLPKAIGAEHGMLVR